MKRHSYLANSAQPLLFIEVDTALHGVLLCCVVCYILLREPDRISIYNRGAASLFFSCFYWINIFDTCATDFLGQDKYGRMGYYIPASSDPCMRASLPLSRSVSRKRMWRHTHNSYLAGEREREKNEFLRDDLPPSGVVIRHRYTFN
jgi:hypothetical protein